MAAINDLIKQIDDPALRDRIQQEVDKINKRKKFGLVFEEHLPECTPIYDMKVKRGSTVALKSGEISDIYIVLNITDGKALCEHKTSHEKAEYNVDDLVCVAEFGEPIYPYLKPIDTVCNAPDSDLWHTLIEADNYHAIQLLEYLYAGKVDCIYIDPPYNTGARDWKYNNDYVDSSDAYRHSKWLSFMERRLKLAKKLLNPQNSVLIVTIDEKEYLHLGCLLEQMFSNANTQMVSTAIRPSGMARDTEFSRANEYIFILRFGSCVVTPLPLSDEWKGNIASSTTNKVRWQSLMRGGSNSERSHSPGCFYPIYISLDKKHILGTGDAIPIGVDYHNVKTPENVIALYPVRPNGDERVWQYSPKKFMEIQKKGYVRLSTQTRNDTGVTIRYISDGWQKKVESNQISVLGKNEDGSLIFDEDFENAFIPPNQWWIRSHNATDCGSKLLQNFIGDRFPYPKSLYAVHDVLRFFVTNNPNALIVDFFAGSGTTLHAVNLLNAEDSGHRRCIMVTNNEVSDAEAKALTKQGYKPGDEEWEKLGIARYVTWPRTVCSIEGHDVNGKPLKGDYLGDGYPDGSPIQMSDGFKANAAFFKLGFLDKTAVALGRQLAELIPILWLKAGAHGACPELKDEKAAMMVLPENRFAILIDEKQFPAFEQEMAGHPEIETIYFVTDSDQGYREMIRSYDDKSTYQLYRDYLDNFRINTRR